MPSRTLTAVWAGLDFALLVAGIISIVFSVMWKNSSLLMNFVLFDLNLTSAYYYMLQSSHCSIVPRIVGIVLGTMFLVSFLVSLFAITQRKPLTGGLRALNWALVLDSLAVLAIGSIIWFYSLREPSNYQKVWLQQPSNIQIALQDKARPSEPSYFPC